MNEHETSEHREPVAEGRQDSSSPKQISRRDFIGPVADGIMTAFATTGITAVLAKWISDRHQNQKVLDELTERIHRANKEYRTALQDCLKHPSQETAETLNSKSMVAHSFYFTLRHHLSPEQKLSLGVAVGDLNEKAIEAIAVIRPQTRYTQHYLHLVKMRHAIWKLGAIGDDDGVRKILEDELERSCAFDKKLGDMGLEQERQYMSQPVEIKESTKP